ncbi:MAG TPA: DUF348 domain-containing protein [Firmicutes bacterium]|nr:DUF348 domain-containing protein [Bacillota bacterium]HOQ23695.1 3D domain-containing protein [Bacillota bacterium]HPT67112.1 3D domain-containing protein [Bacillota bacterium]
MGRRSDVRMDWQRNHHDPAGWGRLVAITLLSLGILSAIMYLVALDRVTVYVDGRVYRRTTAAATVGKVLTELGVTLRTGDQVQPELTEKVREGTEIRVHRGVEVKFHVDGGVQTIRTVPVSVVEALRRAKIELGPDDRVSSPLDDTVYAGQEIRVVRVRKRIVTEESIIKAPVELRKDNSLKEGVRQIVQKGEPGLLRKTVQITEEDGRVVRKKVLAKERIKEPKKQIVAVGTKETVYTMTTSRGREIRYTKVKQMVATAYYPGPESCGKYANGYTATGKKAGFGVVAVDKRVIPLGTRLYIEGYGYAEAADVGSAIRGDRIDLCFDTYREAKMFGKKTVKVYILAPQ